MTITIDSKLDARICDRAQAAGVTVTEYVEQVLQSDQSAEDELESLALDGINSGRPVQVGPDYWIEKHRRLDTRLAARTE
jgi:hypothetical protein